ncbi:MAG: enoyl-CoA hydratase-related protein [Flavobacteriaceae bacterium]|jgi:enoyl-CoA hydratase|nr:enoyl-CoA hydratase-related protein [Flavobacteriaceae bacterium]
MEEVLTWIEIQDNIGWIKINREKKLNALNRSLIDELHDRLLDFQKDASVRVIILTGNGDKAFVAGADIAEFSDFGPLEASALVQHGNQVLFDFIAQLNKPVIAAINGYALGGGLELAMACHFRIASQHAKMGLPEVSLGIIPGYGGTQRLPALIGKGNAMEMILTGDMIDAEKALRLGLVNQVVPQEKLLETAIALAERIMKNAPNSLKNAIKAINAADGSSKGFREEGIQFADCFGSHDFEEGITAFLEKRKPKF